MEMRHHKEQCQRADGQRNRQFRPHLAGCGKILVYQRNQTTLTGIDVNQPGHGRNAPSASQINRPA